MNTVVQTPYSFTRSLSDAGRARLSAQQGEPLLVANWMRVLMIHFEVAAETLQRDTAYQLDLRDGRAFVSVVAFTMEDMRLRSGGRPGKWLLRPIATHDFLNVRTYVKNNGEPGIQFLTEWLSNWLAVKLGPCTFGLPYRHGRIHYEHDWESGRLCGCVTDVSTGAGFSYQAKLEAGAPSVPCERGSLDEWLMERYTAFNCARGRKKLFRIWHPAWPQCRADVEITNGSLIQRNWPWFSGARFVGANFSPGLHGVWMGRPHSSR